ncbi:MAG: DUF3185 domain-containing protein [Chthoniobacterales bacterium]
MKTPTIIGIILIIIGIVSLSIGGFSVTKREKVLDLGPLQASVDKKENYPLPPLLGYAALAGGIVLVAVGATGRKA